MSHETQQFEYRVCYGVADRITFVNGEWQGANVPEHERTIKDMKFCPLVWEYLNHAGADGWELVSLLETPAGSVEAVRTYFLKRATPRSSA